MCVCVCVCVCAVSYTHLDVYKRQVYTQSRPGESRVTPFEVDFLQTYGNGLRNIITIGCVYGSSKASRSMKCYPHFMNINVLISYFSHLQFSKSLKTVLELRLNYYVQ